MKKLLLLSFTSTLLFTNVDSQDIITKKSNEKIAAKVLEVNPTEIKYKKSDNPNGPIFILISSDVFTIKYENGTTDTLDKTSVIVNNDYIKTSNENPEKLLKRGNNAFIEIPDAASRAGERYFIDALKEWGYWNIVTDIKNAHFIIVFNIDKKAMADKSVDVIFKTREQKEFKKSKSYRSSTSAFNGYNAFRAAANKIVEKYFKEKFK